MIQRYKVQAQATQGQGRTLHHPQPKIDSRKPTLWRCRPNSNDESQGVLNPLPPWASVSELRNTGGLGGPDKRPDDRIQRLKKRSGEKNGHILKKICELREYYHFNNVNTANQRMGEKFPSIYHVLKLIHQIQIIEFEEKFCISGDINSQVRTMVKGNSEGQIVKKAGVETIRQR